MGSDSILDVEFCRRHFPALNDGWVFLENAGGTLVPSQVTERLNQYTSQYQVQPGEGYQASEIGARRIAEGQAILAQLINADEDETVIGPSTTSNVYTLSHALKPLIQPGDEIIVTNQDHEANNGAWRALEASGVIVREWRMSSDTDDLEIEDLEALLSDRTKLVCFNHCSNVVGLIHDVKEITRKVHDAGGLVCVDGVALVPHRRVDVKDLDVDFYLYSPYKIFGPHMGVLYGKRELLALLANQSHYFLDDGDFQRRFCPGGYNYELTAAAGGIGEYFDAVHAHHFPGANIGASERLGQVYDLFTAHEQVLSDRVEAFLRSNPAIRLAGPGANGRERVGVFSFVIDGRLSSEIPEKLRAEKIGLYAGDFYAARCIDALGARDQHGFVRASLVHYNSANDVERFIEQLDSMI